MILGSVFYLAAFPGMILDPGYANSLAGRLIGTISGIPSVMGELGLAYGSSSVAREGQHRRTDGKLWGSLEALRRDDPPPLSFTSRPHPQNVRRATTWPERGVSPAPEIVLM